jgi:hypothetical protein
VAGEGGKSVPVRIVVILGATIATLLVIIQLALSTLGKSSDRDSEHYHELVQAIVDQMKLQHSDNMASQKDTRDVLKELAAKQQTLSETFRTAYHLPARTPRKAIPVPFPVPVLAPDPASIQIEAGKKAPTP